MTAYFALVTSQQAFVKIGLKCKNSYGRSYHGLGYVVPPAEQSCTLSGRRLKPRLNLSRKGHPSLSAAPHRSRRAGFMHGLPLWVFDGEAFARLAKLGVKDTG
jgi:hypothetical protein